MLFRCNMQFNQELNIVKDHKNSEWHLSEIRDLTEMCSEMKLEFRNLIFTIKYNWLYDIIYNV